MIPAMLSNHRKNLQKSMRTAPVIKKSPNNEKVLMFLQ